METRSSFKLLKNREGVGRVDLLKSTRSQILIAVLLIALIFAARLLPHAANFTPVAAVGLFAGVYLRGKWAPFLPLAGLFLSDLFIGGYGIRGMTIVYGAFIFTFLIGKIMARRGVFNSNGKFGAKFMRVFGGAIASSVLFFIVTNNIFLYTPAFYPMTFDGMIASYVMGIPFFRNQILGDLIYSGALFGAYEVARVLSARFALRSVES
ncbi:hypothetical protein FWG95_02025 [Candidatus Saccharibacteria bacterium]|nr:hypothetical protein [Candidatus Saccharibacteria bacterium]